MQRAKLFFVTNAAMIAAIYVALTYVFQPISFGEVQLGISEALTILPVFTPTAVPGLFVGCFLGNLLSGALLPDVILGSLATLLGAVGTRLLRNAKPVLASVPPILANALIVPFVLRYAYGVMLPIPLMMLSVAAGEALSCGVLGMLLYRLLKRQESAIFRRQDKRGQGDDFS